MFVSDLGPNTCARCLSPLVDGDITFEYSTSSATTIVFCYECGVIEQSHSTGVPIVEVDKKWHDHFNKGDAEDNEKQHENIQS